MKLLHTADWHLGRVLHSERLIEDQRVLLDQVVDIAIQHQVAAVLVAGDIFDRAVPPPEAITLFSRVIERLCIEAGIPVVMIAGNHDSEDRLDLTPLVLKQGGFHLRSRMTDEIEPVLIEDETTSVAIYPVPYAGPARLRDVFQDESIQDHDSGMRVCAERILSKHDPTHRSVLLAHGWVTGADAHGDERPLTVGNTGQVSASSLDGFDYVAMGHLHRRQTIGTNGNIGYPGSLMQYDFGERTIRPSVDLITIDESTAPVVDQVELTPRRLLYTITSSFDQLMDGVKEDERAEHYVRIILTDKHPIYNPFSRLKEVYPLLLHLQYQDPPAWGNNRTRHSFEEIRRGTGLELFQEFFKSIHERDMDEVELKLLNATLEDLHASEVAE